MLGLYPTAYRATFPAFFYAVGSSLFLLSVCFFVNVCEVGATARGCSGNIGFDDTRGYGVGSGDVGKELPRGMIP